MQLKLFDLLNLPVMNVSVMHPSKRVHICGSFFQKCVLL